MDGRGQPIIHIPSTVSGSANPCTHVGDLALEADVGDRGAAPPEILAEEDGQARHALELAHLYMYMCIWWCKGYHQSIPQSRPRTHYKSIHSHPALYLERVVDPARGPVLRVRRQLQGLHGGQLVAVAEVHVLAVDEPVFVRGMGRGEGNDRSSINPNHGRHPRHPFTAHAQLDLGRRRPLPRVPADDVDALELHHAREGDVQHQLRVVVVAVQPRLRLSPLWRSVKRGRISHLCNWGGGGSPPHTQPEPTTDGRTRL